MIGFNCTKILHSVGIGMNYEMLVSNLKSIFTRDNVTFVLALMGAIGSFYTFIMQRKKSGLQYKDSGIRIDIGVTLNTYTHLGLEDAEDEMKRVKELGDARKELDKAKGEKVVSQKMFRAI